MNDLLGWVSSAIMVLTIVKQVYKQWKEGGSEGVSLWLYGGQIASSIGFILYSWRVHNMVFVVANCCSLLSAMAGVVVMKRNRARKPS